jgi:hypothetical protein
MRCPLRLQSLSIARCALLTNTHLASLLLTSPAICTLTELSLYGDTTYPSPLTPADLRAILIPAPCKLTVSLRFLDISLDDAFLADVPAQLGLRLLGLPYIPAVVLDVVKRFVGDKARGVEVLTLVLTMRELEVGAGVRGVRKAVVLQSMVVGPLIATPLRLRGVEVGSAGALSAAPDDTWSWRVVCG